MFDSIYVVQVITTFFLVSLIAVACVWFYYIVKNPISPVYLVWYHWNGYPRLRMIFSNKKEADEYANWLSYGHTAHLHNELDSLSGLCWVEKRETKRYFNEWEV